ncbi:pyruvate dehydrogenase (acetyl-transferring) E1 component subunit alpha [Halorubellus sp. JP-L1]|uniref:pyruvate dehydrogenase (acetyl-transferring) E1 component subunit alpha n=1 Tax=Halorubellus sp. JP-L1 TaxID=2715753 RepID=UPI001F04283E|nr:pyruvate dehydrogenase (acetyl-transferring) E1 component subunit alpha [Halorubellus sp. JP-L1]
MSKADNIVRVMSPGGSQIDDHSVSAERARSLYETMVLARTFDEKAVSLHRQGRIGTYAPMAGQEAAQVGAAAAMPDRDYLFPTYRDHAMYLQRGLDLREVLLHLSGDGNYIDREDPADLTTFPPTIPIATQLPHAVGVGMAAKYKGDDVASLVSFGDGATSEGDFHEALNFAGVFETPTVFFCQNNGYAISVPRERQTASATIAQKAQAYGFDGVRVDGNDVFAVYDVVTEALEKARNGGGPTLIEAVTYRKGAHTTTDDPSKYRDEADAEDWRLEDPLDRARTYLGEEFEWSETDEAATQEWATETVKEAVTAAEEHTGYDAGEMFENVFAEMPAHLREQRRDLVADPQVER